MAGSGFVESTSRSPKLVVAATAAAARPCAAVSLETWAVNTMTRGEACVATFAISIGVSRALSGTAAAPRRLHARMSTAVARQFSATSSTRSPSPTPCEASHAAPSSIAAR